MLVAVNAVRITLSVDALMMMADDRRNVVVRLYLAQDPLTDVGVLLHFPPLFQGKGPFLPEEARGSPTLPMSCTSPQRNARSQASAGKPMRSAMSRE